MLSRVAENLYWMARYIERAENGARLVSAHANLLLDLPRHANPGWEPLIAITGGGEAYRKTTEGYAERDVVNWLLRERTNPGSILSSLTAARENCRTMRDVLPRLAWEYVNELYLAVEAATRKAPSKQARPQLLKQVVSGAQAISGLLAGTMNHDEGYEFLCIGGNLERADMTTRIIDVSCHQLIAGEDAGLRPFDNILWTSVLKSLTGYHMFRRATGTRVARPAVLRFLFQSAVFPRSFHHAIHAVERSAHKLPNPAPLLARTAALERMVQRADLEQLGAGELSAFVDTLQIGLGQLHDQLYECYFAPPVGRMA